MTLSESAPEEVDSLPKLSARVSQLEDRLHEMMLSPPAGAVCPESNLEWLRQGTLSPCSADLAEARWEILQEMIEQEQEERIESTKIINQTLAALPALAAQALTIDAKSENAWQIQQKSEVGDAAMRAFDVLVAGVRSELQQQLQQSEAELRSWVQSMLGERLQVGPSNTVSEAALPPAPNFPLGREGRDSIAFASPEPQRSRGQDTSVSSSPHHHSVNSPHGSVKNSPEHQPTWKSFTASAPLHGGSRVTVPQSPILRTRQFSSVLPKQQSPGVMRPSGCSHATLLMYPDPRSGLQASASQKALWPHYAFSAAGKNEQAQ